MDWVTQAFSVYSALGLGWIGTLIVIIIVIFIVLILLEWAIFWFFLPFYVRHISKYLALAMETLVVIGRQQEITNELLAQIVKGAAHPNPPNPPNNIKKDEPKIKSEPSGMIIVPKGSR